MGEWSPMSTPTNDTVYKSGVCANPEGPEHKGRPWCYVDYLTCNEEPAGVVTEIALAVQAGLLHWDYCPMENAAAMAVAPAAAAPAAAVSPNSTAAAAETSGSSGSGSSKLVAIVVPCVVVPVVVILCLAFRIWKHRNYKVVYVPRNATDIEDQGPCLVEQHLLGIHLWSKSGQACSVGAAGSSAARSSTSTATGGQRISGKRSADCVLSGPNATGRSSVTVSGGGGDSAQSMVTGRSGEGGSGREDPQPASSGDRTYATGLSQDLAGFCARPTKLLPAASSNWRQSMGRFEL